MQKQFPPAILLAVCIATLLPQHSLRAQSSSTPASQEGPATPPTPKRPSIGLVLQGGGALGLAHVGVIAWLEEHHIPVSYVAGTSMGGLIGGVYATGRSATEVRALVDSIHWDKVMAGQTPFNDLSFRRKEDARDYPNNLEFGLRKGVQFPEGFNSGQQVTLILDKVALPYSQNQSFNDLPIPFACVATDLVTGKPHVFRDGSLSVALRSTMSLPAVFTPVRANGTIYADGGLLNNIPIDVAKEMGADITLGVHLDEAGLDPKDSLSSVAVMGRSVSVMINANELQSMEKADLLISVPLAKYGTLDFNKAGEIIKAGYDAAESKSKVLSTLSVDQATWDRYIHERESRRKTAPIPTFVAVTGSDPHLTRQVEKQMADVVGKPIDTTQLDQNIMRLKGLGRFANLSYQYSEREGKPGLEIQTVENPYGPPIVRPLLLIDGSDWRDVAFNVGARITWIDLGGFRSEWRNDIILGQQYGIRSEYYHPFYPTSAWFIAPRAFADNDEFNIFQKTNLIAQYRRAQDGGGLDIGRQFGTTGELRVGYEGGWEHFVPAVGDPTLFPTLSGTYAGALIQYRFDRLDNAVIPRQGQAIDANFNWYNVSPYAKEQYPALEIASRNFFRINDPSSFSISGFGGTTFDHATGLPQFSLGGSQRFLAYGTNELLTDKYLLFQMSYLRRLSTMPPLLGSGIYAMGTYEIGQLYGKPINPMNTYPSLPNDFAAGIIVNSIFGPVELAYAVGDSGHHKFFFRIGRLF
jgi:NTE family protein